MGNEPDQEKVSPRLRAKLDAADSDHDIDVVIELKRPALPTVGSRSQKVAAAKELFDREAAPVTERISAAGGEVVGTAWINSTIRTKLRAEQVEDLATDDRVVALDLPRQLEAES